MFMVANYTFVLAGGYPPPCPGLTFFLQRKKVSKERRRCARFARETLRFTRTARLSAARFTRFPGSSAKADPSAKVYAC